MGAGSSGAAARSGGASGRTDPWKAAFVALLIVGLLAVVVWLLLGSRVLVVRDVAVSGTQRVDAEEVVAAADVPTGTPLVRVDTEAAAAGVEELHLVEAARVRRGWPATLSIDVVERTPTVSVRVEEGYHLVDREGIMVTDSAERPEEYPLVRIRGEIQGNSGIAAAATVAGDLAPEMLAQVEYIDASDEDRLLLHLGEGSAVVWGDAAQSRRKADALGVLLREHPPEEGRDYDVSAPEVVVVGSAEPGG